MNDRNRRGTAALANPPARLLSPHFSHSPTPPELAQLGDIRSFPVCVAVDAPSQKQTFPHRERGLLQTRCQEVDSESIAPEHRKGTCPIAGIETPGSTFGMSDPNTGRF